MVNIYNAKREFVEGINETLQSIGEVASVKYRHMPDKYTEFVQIKYPGGKTDYIDVTADSCKCIFVEVARAINNQNPLGYIVDGRLYEQISKWWEAEDEKGQAAKTDD